MFTVKNSRSFANGTVYAIETEDGYPVEVTDTFLPSYTRDAIGKNQNNLVSKDLGDRSQRWMIGVSCMSGCPIGCKFCATGQLKKTRMLKANEIIDQIMFIRGKNANFHPNDSFEFKINYTRMGEPFLNLEEIKKTIEYINELYPNTHHYISTIGIKDSDFSWIKDNITLQVSLHSLNEERREDLIPYKNKMSIEELGSIRTKSDLKTSLNMTLVDEQDFNIEELKRNFDTESFFIKLSPINPNCVSDENDMGSGIIKSNNLV